MLLFILSTAVFHVVTNQLLFKLPISVIQIAIGYFMLAQAYLLPAPLFHVVICHYSYCKQLSLNLLLLLPTD